MGDGVRTVRSSFKVTVELIQFVGQEKVINGERGFRLEVWFCLEGAQSDHRVCFVLKFLGVQPFSFYDRLTKPVLRLF